MCVQQHLAECTAIFTVCIAEHHAHLFVQWQYTKPAHINSETDSKTVTASKIKCAGNTPNTLIIAK